MNNQIHLKYSTELTIREITKANIRPSSCEAELMTNTVCCFSGGFGNLKAYVDKNIYVAGESVLLTCSLDNMNTSSNFNVKAQLVQVLSINGEELAPHVFKNIIYED